MRMWRDIAEWGVDAVDERSEMEGGEDEER
jgi:hypothetical protein